MFTLFCLATLLAALGACASPSIRYSGVITASDDPHAREVPTRQVALQDKVVIVTHVAWLDADEKGGLHAVRWKWYEGEKLIAERAKTLEFGRTPARFSRRLQAADLGVGHYRVEVLVDGRRVDAQSFDDVAC